MKMSTEWIQSNEKSLKAFILFDSLLKSELSKPHFKSKVKAWSIILSYSNANHYFYYIFNENVQK